MVPSSFITSQMTPAEISPPCVQVDGCSFGRAHQHPALACAQRKDMTGARQVVGVVFGRWRRESCARGRPLRRRWSHLAASMVSVNAVPKRDVFSAVMGGRRR